MSDIKRYRGDTKDLILILSQNSEVFPLAGCSATLSVATTKEPTGNTYILQSTAIVDNVAGTLTFPFTVENANNLGDFFYDVELVDALGKISTILKAKMKFTQDITK